MEIKRFELSVRMKRSCQDDSGKELWLWFFLAQYSTLNQACVQIIVARAQNMPGEVAGGRLRR